jgi:glycosyltransferase involved in cell wall biosynthesis
VLVWGEGREQEALVALSQRLGTVGLVRFVGTAEPVARFLDGLDVYAQPSRNEGMGRALVLAQGAGLPIVASRVCGIPDVVRHEETGILVEPDDPAALAAGLERLLADPGRRDRYATAARSWVLSDDETGLPRFSVEAMLWRLERLYRRLAG